MRNCIILGSGRSGTSMVAGTLSKAGYFMGDGLWPARESNPKGFFEDAEINGINEQLLAQVVPGRPPFARWLFRDRPIDGQRWLARVAPGTPIPCSTEISARIRRITERQPYCFKDPRFSYTLAVWRPFLTNVVFVCVFRDPASTARSILKECKDSTTLQDLKMTFSAALEVWTLMYRHILERHRFEGSWVFIHYDQMLRPEGLRRLESFIGAPVDGSFPEGSLRRSFSEHPVPRETQCSYQQLCELAGYEDPPSMICQ